MSKKLNRAETESIVDRAILAKARIALDSDRPRGASRCVICGGEAAPTSLESLCWVCRRLKISAWRDIDPQVSVQE